MNPILKSCWPGVSALMLALYATPVMAQDAGITRVETLASPALAADALPDDDQLRYALYLPAGYEAEADTDYPVLYLLHGSAGTDTSWDDFWPVLDDLIAEGDIPPLIAVAPVTGNSYWVDSDTFGAVESAVIDDLIGHIDASYSTIAQREGRALAGFSMGGYGALRYGLTYPELFSGAVLLSPAIQDGQPPATAGAVERGSFGAPFDPERWDALNYPAALETYAAQPHRVPVFIYAGDDDWNHLSEQDDLPQDAYRFNMEMQAVTLYQRLARVNIFGEDFDKWEDVPGSPAELRIVDGGHDTALWIPGFEEGLHYLFANGLSAPTNQTRTDLP